MFISLLTLSTSYTYLAQLKNKQEILSTSINLPFLNIIKLLLVISQSVT